MFSTSKSFAPLILRLMLGGVMFPHGAQKVLGLFGGQGFQATLDGMTTGLGLPMAAVILVMAAEFLGSIGLVLGFVTRLAALGIAAVMGGAIYLAHLPHGFFMNWHGTQSGEGFEYHLLAIGMALALVITGAGRWSLDGRLGKKRAA